MKTKLFLVIAAAAMVFAACSKDLYNEGSESTTTDPPPYAANNKIWKFGDQVWSDAIWIPECNKTSFEDSYDEPRCRSHTAGANTWYYYNWAYVSAHAARLCPSPWHVPTETDFRNLLYGRDLTALVKEWRRAGYAYDAFIGSGSQIGVLWSGTVSSSHSAYALCYFNGDPSVCTTGAEVGLPVRCVK